jgi:nitrite reductase/ring-hydroxylating ferredoxin subunit/uncharacterized membrane protein
VNLISLAARWGDEVAEAFERSPLLDRTGKTLTNFFARFVRAGTLKDLLAGTWLGHPLHPVLTDVPIGAWTGAMALDVFGGERSRGASNALVSLGIAGAIPTAVTGLSELADTSDRRERSLAAAHAVGNIAAVLLYFFSLIARRRGNRQTGVMLSTAGWAAVLGSGFLGGHLAFRKGLGVDRTVFEPVISNWTAAMAQDDLPERKLTRARIEGTDVLLYRADGRIHALAARCSHRGGPLHKGRVEGVLVTCPWHLSTFDLRDGSIVRGPATAPEPAFEVRVTDGTIEVRSRRD